MQPRNTAIAFVLIATLLLACTVLADNLFEVKTLTNNCRRSIQINSESSGRSLLFETKGMCMQPVTNQTQPSIQRFGELKFITSVNRVPVFTMNGQTSVQAQFSDGVKPVTVKVQAGVGFDVIVEYEEKNGVAGFQPDGDKIVNKYPLLNSLVNGGDGKSNDRVWTPIRLTQTNPGNNSTVFTATSSYNIPNFANVSITGILTTDEVVYKDPKNGQRTDPISGKLIQQVLTPNSYKAWFEVKNIVYANANTRLAIGTFVAFQGKFQDLDPKPLEPPREEKSKRQVKHVEERPDSPSSEQKVVKFDGNLSTQLNGSNVNLPNPFFSFMNFISKILPDNTTIQYKIVASGALDEIVPESDFVKSEVSDPVIKRFWVSLPEQVDNLSWDPSIGTADELAVAASAHGLVGSLILSVLVILSLFMFAL